jgi:hypothetical protein
MHLKLFGLGLLFTVLFGCVVIFAFAAPLIITAGNRLGELTAAKQTPTLLVKTAVDTRVAVPTQKATITSFVPSPVKPTVKPSAKVGEKISPPYDKKLSGSKWIMTEIGQNSWKNPDNNLDYTVGKFSNNQGGYIEAYCSIQKCKPPVVGSSFTLNAWGVLLPNDTKNTLQSFIVIGWDSK